VHMAQLMPLPLTVSRFSKIQTGFTFPVPAHLGSPRKGPLNGCVCVCVCVFKSAINISRILIGRPRRFDRSIITVDSSVRSIDHQPTGDQTTMLKRVSYLPVNEAERAHQVSARLQLDVLVVLRADLAQLERRTHLAVDLVLLGRHLDVVGLRDVR